jgi:hypothetical protein
MYLEFKKNLILINQFTHDNKAFIEFHPHYLCVNDLRMRKLLLLGPTKEVLYPWPLSSSSPSSLVAFVGQRVSLDQWHHRLVHPTPPVV